MSIETHKRTARLHSVTNGMVWGHGVIAWGGSELILGHFTASSKNEEIGKKDERTP